MNYFRNALLTLVMSTILFNPILMAVDAVLVKTADGASMPIPRQELTLAHTFNDFISTDKLISSFTDPNFDPTLTPIQEFDLTSNEALQELDLTSNEYLSAAFYEVKAYLDWLYNFYIEQAQIDLPPGAPIIDDHFDRVREKNRLDAVSLFMKKIPQLKTDTISFIDLLHSADNLGITELSEACLITIINHVHNRGGFSSSDHLIRQIRQHLGNMMVRVHHTQVNWPVIRDTQDKLHLFAMAFEKDSINLSLDQALFLNARYNETTPFTIPVFDSDGDNTFQAPIVAAIYLSVFNLQAFGHCNKTIQATMLTQLGHVLASFLWGLNFKMNLSWKYSHQPQIFDSSFKDAFMQFTPTQQRALYTRGRPGTGRFTFLPSHPENVYLFKKLLISSFFFLEWYLYGVTFYDLNPARCNHLDERTVKGSIAIAGFLGALMFMQYLPQFLENRPHLSLKNLVDRFYDAYLREYFGDEKIEDLFATSHDHED